MKKLFLLLLLFTLASLQAQITLSPEKPGFTETVTLTFHADQGNKGLADCDCEVYAHTGIINSTSAHAGDWKKVVADWGENKPELKLEKTGDNLYQLQFKISELYGIPPAGDLTALAFVFRNADGSKVGKTKEGQDIFYFFKEPVFKKRPEADSVSLTPHPDWAEAASIYEVNLRQYTEEGTINAFAKHLPRLRKLGVDILWFMPVQPIGVEKRKGPLGSYYSIQDYTAVNPEFGTMEDFKAMVKKAHGLGFRVVLDWVANHSAWDNPWVERHPEWYSKDEQGNMIAPFDWTDVADLNYDMYYMRREMIESMAFWLRECDIDGFRCDVAGEVPLDFWEDARHELEAIKPIWMIAENADQLFLMNRAFNANYDWGFHHLMNQIAKGEEPSSRLFSHFAQVRDYYPKGSYPMQFITNHDENSWNGTVFERLGEGHKAFATLSFTVPGMPLIYSGQEAAMKKRLKFFDKDPIEWGDYPLMDFYTKLNQLKAENPALWNGNAGGSFVEIKHHEPESVAAFVREKEGNKVLVVINLSGQSKNVKLQLGEHAGVYRNVFSQSPENLKTRAPMFLDAWDYGVFVLEEKLPETMREFKSMNPTKTGLEIKTNDGRLLLNALGNNSVQVEFVPEYHSNPLSASVATFPQESANSPRETADAIDWDLGDLSVHIDKKPLRISYSYKNKPIISEAKGFHDDGTWMGFNFTLQDGEMLTGGGSRAGGIDRRGKRFQLYNKPSYGYEDSASWMYYSLPVVLSNRKYMLVFDNAAKGYMDLAAANDSVLEFGAVGGRMSYVVVADEDWKGLAENFTAVFGRQSMPPRWSLGNIASRMGYHSQAEVESVVDQYLKDDIPLDGIVLDLFWFGPDVKGHLGNLEWDRDSFPEPDRMMADLKKKGVKTVLITEPFILKGSGKFQECVDKGLLGLNKSGEPYLYDFYFGNTALLDIFKKETRDWFWNDIYKKHTRSGVAGWWGDLGEPEVHPDDLLHVNGRGDEVHNKYGHIWAKTIHDGFAKDFPKRRPVILMRSGFVGSQRYGMIPWTGDVNRSWGGLRPQVELSLTMGLQGLAWMHSDLGGFGGSYEDSELYIRWLQYGVFQPMYRTHAQESVPAEPIYWDDTTKTVVRSFIKMRYRMMPYNYTLAWENATKGTPMMRPIMYLEDSDEHFTNKNEYLWGDAFLVAPVVNKGAIGKKVYFPGDKPWFDIWSGERHEGGSEAVIPLSISTIPVFVRAGSFVPMVPSFQSCEEYSSEKLDLYYYHDASVKTASGQMYEDDGETKGAYEKGDYELIAFEAEQGTNASLGDYLELSISGMKMQREISLFIMNIYKQPSSLLINGGLADENAFMYNPTTGKLKVDLPAFDKDAEVIISWK
jgi:oligosaccharide 4-alpha-D-glucosyltransferase